MAALAGGAVAGVGRARIAVFAVRPTRARPAAATLAQLEAVAAVAVAARRAVGHVGVLAAVHCVARVGRTSFAVVAVGRDPGGTDAGGAAGLATVAHRCVVAGGP